jgi:hypothetical protein
MTKRIYAPRPPKPIPTLPNELCEMVIELAGAQASQDKASSKALQRLLDKKSEDLAKAYKQLASKHDLKTIAYYWASAYQIHLDIQEISPALRSKYVAWIDKVQKLLVKLACTLDDHPSPDLVLPEILRSAGGMVGALLQKSGDESLLATFISQPRVFGDADILWKKQIPKKAGGKPRRTHELASVKGKVRSECLDEHLSTEAILIRRYLDELALPDAFITLANGVGAYTKIKPEMYWNQGQGMVDPRKHGHDGVSAKEQILLRSVKLLTKERFAKPHHGIVAALVNALLGKQRFTAETVRRAPV